MVSAEIGLSIPYMGDNTFHVDADEDAAITFILKNSGNVQETVKTRFSIPHGVDALINDVYTYEQTYTLAPYENRNIEVEVQPAGHDAAFGLTYGFLSVPDSGDVMFDVWVEGVLNVEIGDCDGSCNLYKLDLPFNTYQYLTIELDDVEDGFIVDGLKFITSYGYIEFRNDVDLEGFLEDYVVIENNRVYIDSDAFPNLDEKANVYMKGLPYNSEPIILKDGDECGSDCDILSYNTDTGTLKFTVKGFSEYTTRADEGLFLSVDGSEEGSNSGSNGAAVSSTDDYVDPSDISMNIVDGGESAFNQLDAGSATDSAADRSILDRFKGAGSSGGLSSVAKEFPLIQVVLVVLIAGLLAFIYFGYNDEDVKREVDRLKQVFKKGGRK